MPSWKKVIISGSNAELSSLYAPSITGSLQGTASFAKSASTFYYELANVDTDVPPPSRLPLTFIQTSSVDIGGYTNAWYNGNLTYDWDNSTLYAPYYRSSYVTGEGAVAFFGTSSAALTAVTASYFNAAVVTTGSGTDFSLYSTSPMAGNSGTRLPLSGSITFGYQAGYNSSASKYVNLLGFRAGYQTNDVSYSNFLGHSAGSGADNADQSQFIGYRAGYLSTGANNSVFIGYLAGQQQASASYSIIIGNSSGRSGSWGALGNNNIIIGTNISLPTGYANYANIGGVLFISGTYGTTSGNNSTGSQANGRIGIGIVNPSASLHITNTSNANSFLVEDATNPDNTPFLIDNAGNVMIGTTSSKGEVTIAASGADGLVLDTDTSSDTNSSRIFLKNSGSGRDISLRNSGHALYIGHSATAGTTSGPYAMIISGSGVAIGNNYTISAARGAALQVSGSINIEEGFAYKQDSENVIRIAKSTSPVTATYTNTIAGASAADGVAYLDQLTAFGYQALYQSSGSDQTAFGYTAGYQNSGSSSTLIGWSAGYQAKASNQTAIGVNAGYQNSGTYQTTMGVNAGYQNSASYQTAVGINAGRNNSGSTQTAIGNEAGRLNSGTNQTSIGSDSGYQNTGVGQVAVGTFAGQYNIGSYQVALGGSAGVLNTGSNQVAVGYQAGRRNTQDYQTAVGFESGYFNSGSNQSVFGWRAGYQNTGAYQTAVGNQAGYQNSGSNQTAVGYNAGFGNSGSDNTNVGYRAGYLITTGTVNSQSAQSVFFGSETRAQSGNQTNQIVIGYNAIGIGSNSVVLGNSSITTTALRGKVGIGTTTPTYTLQINAGPTASIRLEETGSGGNKRLDLTIDGSATARISANQSAQSLAFDTSGGERLRITKDGDIGIGISTPLASLHTSGSAIISGSMVIGSSSLGPSENTLTLGARDAVNEGGQLGFNAPGGTYTSASFIDLYQNRLRILKGTNATSTGEVANWNMHNLQMALPAYTSPSSFTGTAAGYLAFDTSGNILTVGGVAATPGGTTTQLQYNNAGVLAGTSAITFDGTTLRATGSFTGSLVGALTGTASFAVSASISATSSFITASGVFGPYGSNSVTSASFAVSASQAATASYSKNLQISGSINNVDYIDFNTGSAEPAWKSGRVYWNNTDGALSVYNAEADISLQVGQENWVRVRNDTGVLITNGTAVRLIGSHGDAPEIQLAQSTQVSGSITRDNQILGIATHDIENSSFGFVTTQGLIRGLNTSAYLEGDRLFVSSSAGKLTKIPPIAPYEIIPAAVVVKSGPAGSGILYAYPQQPMDFTDLSSVEVGDYTYGDILTYKQSGSVGVWAHTNQLSGSYGLTGSLSATSFTGSLQGTASYDPTIIRVSGSSIYSLIDPVVSNFSTEAGIYIGSGSGNNSVNAFASVFIGRWAGLEAVGTNRAVAIGQNAGAFTSGSINSVFIGTGAGSGSISSSYSNFIGATAGEFANDTIYSNFIGVSAGDSSNGLYRSNIIGFASGLNASGSYRSNWIGQQAGESTSGSYESNFIGYAAGYENIDTYRSNYIGHFSGYRSTRSHNSNFIGSFAGRDTTGSDYSNFVGSSAGRGTVGAEYSTLLGYQAGYAETTNSIGSNNIIIGTNITLASGSKDSINIGGIIFGTGSYATTTGNPSSGSVANGRIGIGTTNPNATLDVNGNTIISGSLTVTSDFTLLGSASIQYITSSQLNIADNLITVNTYSPTFKFGGIAVIDSGSGTPYQSGSLLFNSEQDEWIFVHKAPGVSPITSSLLIMGPESYDSLGSEIYPTTNRIMKSLNDEHIGDSNITDTGTVVSINSYTEITGSVLISGSLTVGGIIFGNLGMSMSGSNNITGSLIISGSDTALNVKGNTIITGSLNVSGSYQSPSGNTIDSNALIQASLLYLSNNF